MSSCHRFTVYSSATVVGWTDLEFTDPPMGVAFGRFFPAPGYDLIKARVREAAAGEHRFEMMASLALSVSSQDGDRLNAEGGISIDSPGNDSEETDIEITVAGVKNFETHFPGAHEHYIARLARDP